MNSYRARVALPCEKATHGAGSRTPCESLLWYQREEKWTHQNWSIRLCFHTGWPTGRSTCSFTWAETRETSIMVGVVYYIRVRTFQWVHLRRLRQKKCAPSLSARQNAQPSKRNCEASSPCLVEQKVKLSYWIMRWEACFVKGTNDINTVKNTFHAN